MLFYHAYNFNKYKSRSNHLIERHNQQKKIVNSQSKCELQSLVY